MHVSKTVHLYEICVYLLCLDPIMAQRTNILVVCFRIRKYTCSKHSILHWISFSVELRSSNLLLCIHGIKADYEAVKMI